MLPRSEHCSCAPRGPCDRTPASAAVNHAASAGTKGSSPHRGPMTTTAAGVTAVLLLAALATCTVGRVMGDSNGAPADTAIATIDLVGEALHLDGVAVEWRIRRRDGFCLDAGQKDQNAGVVKHFDAALALGGVGLGEAECLQWCKLPREPPSTGCERITLPSSSETGCYRHTKPVASSNGQRHHTCWLFPAMDLFPTHSNASFKAVNATAFAISTVYVCQLSVCRCLACQSSVCQLQALPHCAVRASSFLVAAACAPAPHVQCLPRRTLPNAPRSSPPPPRQCTRTHMHTHAHTHEPHPRAQARVGRGPGVSFAHRRSGGRRHRL